MTMTEDCDVSVINAGPRLIARGMQDVISSAATKKAGLENVRLPLDRFLDALREIQRREAAELKDGTVVEADCVPLKAAGVPVHGWRRRSKFAMVFSQARVGGLHRPLFLGE